MCLLRDHNCKGEQVVAGECGGLTVRTLQDGGVEEVEEEIRTRSYLWEYMNKVTQSFAGCQTVKCKCSHYANK